MSLAFSITWLKPAARIANSLFASDPASEIVSMPKSSKLPEGSVIEQRPTGDQATTKLFFAFLVYMIWILCV